VAAVDGQFLDMFASNELAEPGGMTVLGSSVDLTQVNVDAYVTGGTTDHLTPWRTSAPAAARSQQAGSSWGNAMAGGRPSDTGYGQSRR